MSELHITINGKALTVPAGLTILEAAKQNGIYIPTLCALEGLKPKAACKLCMVSITGESKEKLACAVKAAEGMEIRTDSEELFQKRKSIVQELFRQHAVDCHHCLRIGSTKAKDFDPSFCENCFFCDCVRDGSCELQAKALEFGVDELPFEIHEHDFGTDCSTGSVIRCMDKCIRCRRCVDVCTARGVGILAMVKTEKGSVVKSPAELLADGCIRCGHCVDVCPTGALYMKEHKDEIVYFAHQYQYNTAALLAPEAAEKLAKQTGESFSYEQLVSAVKKFGVDHVYHPAKAQAAADAQAAALLDARLGGGPLVLTNSYAAKVFLTQNYPELQESFAFYDSVQKCAADAIRAASPNTKVIQISTLNSDGAEAEESCAADYFVNPAELRRILQRTGAAPQLRKPAAAEELPIDAAEEPEYELLLHSETAQAGCRAKKLSFSRRGKKYTALICHNPAEWKKAAETIGKYDVIVLFA